MSEDQIVRIYRERFGLGEDARNDVEAMRMGNRLLVSKVDTLVYGTDVPPGMTPRKAARKAAVACISDFAAKGVRPRWALVSITAPTSCTARTHGAMAAGLADAADAYGFKVLGGDTNRGAEISITVCMMGIAKGIFPRRDAPADRPGYWKRPPSVPSRGGASPGDRVLATGPFGLSAAGLYAVSHGVAGPRGSLRAVMEPRARLNFGARAAPYLSSTMDSSDGLSTTLNEMAARSGVAIIVDCDPAAAGVAEFAAKHGLDPDDLVYHGGEEYEIVFTLRRGGINDIFSAIRDTRIPLTPIGRVEEGEGVYLERDGRTRLTDEGWKAF